MKKLILLLALVPCIGLSQAQFDTGLLFDGKGIKLSAAREIAPLSYKQSSWMKALTIERFGLELVAAMKPDTNEQLWTGMGIVAWLKPLGAVTPCIRAGFTSNILRESFDNTQALWYIGAGIKF